MPAAAKPSLDRHKMGTLSTVMKDIENAGDQSYIVVVGSLQLFEQNGAGGLGESLGTIAFSKDGMNVGRWTP